MLIVSTDAHLRAVAARAVIEEGYRVITAPHAGHALLACLRERVDVLATELSMEDTSGPALAARLRRYYPDLRTVYFANPGATECDGVLVRPFSGRDLLKAVASARPTVVCAATSSVA